MAKGVEDTAFYCWNRLMAMNEVGGDPDCDGLSLEEFHAYHAKMQADASCDDDDAVHARYEAQRRCAGADAGVERDAGCVCGGGAAVECAECEASEAETDRSDDRGRSGFCTRRWWVRGRSTESGCEAYMQKAMREAKVRTSWVANNEEYESALNAYIDALLGRCEVCGGAGGVCGRTLQARGE